MKKNQIFKFVFLLLFLSLMVSCSKDKGSFNQPILKNLSLQNNQSADKISNVNAAVTVFASNISFPRGLKFGPNGYLYVALAGTGGTNSTTCTQVIPPVGPYMGGNTGSIIKISPKGTVSTVVDRLPSSVNGEAAKIGPADVAFMGDQLYALLVAGCSHGNSDAPSSVIKVNQRSSGWSVVADLSTFYQNNPTAVLETDDFEPDGTPYSMIKVKGDFYVVEPNHGELDKVTTDGKIKRVIDLSADYGHIVPTVVAFNDGNFYVSNLRTFPLVGGSSSVYKITPGGKSTIFATGFTGVLGIAFDKEERLYVLETSQGGGPTPMTGRVVRINEDNSRDIIVDALFFPTGMTFGPDGALYISNTGFGPPTGQILKVVFNHGMDKHDNKDGHGHGKRQDN